jgi:hypothetical protein
MAAMASLAPGALSVTPARKVQQRDCPAGAAAEGVASGVQLRRNSDVQWKALVAVRGRGRGKEKRVVEFGGAVRGFSEPGEAGPAPVEGLPGSHDLPNLSVRSRAVVEMKKGYGAFGGGGATLEKSKLDLSQSTARVKQEVRELCGF